MSSRRLCSIFLQCTPHSTGKLRRIEHVSVCSFHYDTYLYMTPITTTTMGDASKTLQQCAKLTTSQDTRQICHVRKLAAKCHKAPLEKQTAAQSRSAPPYTAPLRERILGRADCTHECANEHSMKFSTLCSPSSSEDKLPSSVSDEVPSFPPKAKVRQISRNS